MADSFPDLNLQAILLPSEEEEEEEGKGAEEGEAAPTEVPVLPTIEETEYNTPKFFFIKVHVSDT